MMEGKKRTRGAKEKKNEEEDAGLGEEEKDARAR
jgi:hypothetical protein